MASQAGYAALYKSAVNKPYTFSVDILGSDTMLASWQAATAQGVVRIHDSATSGALPFTNPVTGDNSTKITLYFWRTGSSTYKVTCPVLNSATPTFVYLTASNGISSSPSDINLTEAGCRLTVSRDAAGVYTISVNKLDGTAITSAVFSGGNAPYQTEDGDVLLLGDSLNTTPGGGKVEYKYVNASYKNISVT